MNNVKVVSAFVPLKVKHLTAEQYHAYGDRLVRAADGHIRVFDDFPYEDCWLAKENPPMVPATPPAPDRYETSEDFARSNVIQHSRTQWARLAVEEDPAIDVIIWLDYAVLKQGAWRNNPVKEEHIWNLIKKCEKYPFDDIPFPGIEPVQPVNPHGNNWRFVGSTHIWPVKWLPLIDTVYKFATRRFIRHYTCTPLDLAIWPTVEQTSGLPFKFYQAEYDASQLTGFPDARSD